MHSSHERRVTSRELRLYIYIRCKFEGNRSDRRARRMDFERVKHRAMRAHAHRNVNVRRRLAGKGANGKG